MSAGDATVGVSVGLLIAAVLGMGILRLSWRIPLHRFFEVPGIVLVIIGAGLFATSVHEPQDGFSWAFGSGFAYNLSGVFSSVAENPTGYLLRDIVGYNDSPTILESIAHVASWVFNGVVYLGIRSGRITIVTNPLRGVWRSVIPKRSGIRERTE